MGTTSSFERKVVDSSITRFGALGQTLADALPGRFSLDAVSIICSYLTSTATADLKPRCIKTIATYGGGKGQVSECNAIALDFLDRVWIADRERLQCFDSKPPYKFLFEALNNEHANGIACDINGDVWLTHAASCTISVLRSDGKLLKRFGTRGSANGEFRFPMGIAIDVRKGLVYITDSGNNRVCVFTRAGSFVKAWGSRGEGDGQFQNPNGVGIRGQEVFVCDNYRIQVFRDGVFDRKTCKEATSPRRIAFDPLNGIVVCEPASQRVRFFDRNGDFISIVNAYTDSFMGEPMDICVRWDGRMYIADRTYHLQEWDFHEPELIASES